MLPALWPAANPLPAHFYHNGQEAFVVRTAKMHVFFSATSVEYRHAGARLRVNFENSNPDVTVEGEGLQPGVVNLLIGEEPEKWRKGIPVYSGIIYRNLYPGIDLRYYTQNGELKAEYVVRPGADSRKIRLHYGGARAEVEPGGDLVVRSSEGELRESGLRTFGRNRRFLRSRFLAMGESVTGFEVQGASSDEPIVIDPVIVFSSYIGGSGFDGLTSVATDSAGNMYAAGWTASPDFPVRSPLQGLFAGTVDAVVVKVDASNNLVYETYLGGSDDDRAFGLAVDISGNAIVTGWTYSRNFPRVSAAQSAIGGGRDAFVAKLNAAGNGLMFSTFLGGSDSDSGNAATVDNSGNIYVVGDTSSTGFPVMGAYQWSLSGGTDAFAAKYSAAGTMIFSTYLGGAKDDRATGVAVDSSSAVYVVGSTYSTNYPVFNAFQPALGGGQDAFLTKLNSAASGLVYSTYLGGPDRNNLYESATSVAVDSSGNAIVAGYTCSPSFPLANALQPAFGGGNADAFVTKFNSSGSGLLFSTFLGGSSDDQIKGVALATDGGVVVAGYTGSSDFPIANAVQASKSTGYDAIVARLSATGATLDFSSFVGGSGADDAFAVAVDPSGNYLLAGQTQSTDIPLASPLQSSNGGSYGGFLMRIQTSSTGPSRNVTILTPVSTGSYGTGSSTLNMSGTAFDSLGVTQVSWTCDRCGSGVATGTTSWSISGIELAAGVNVITVTSWDASNLKATATLTVTYSNDTVPPTIAIALPVTTANYNTTSSILNVSGTASDNTGVTQVTWICSPCSGSNGGTAAGTANWSVTGMTLSPGANVFVAFAFDAGGNQGLAILSINYTPDTTPPSVSITSPVSSGAYSTSLSSLSIGGSASDNVGVTQVTWACDRCGGGTAAGTANWTVTGITLQSGVNVITVTARDAAGNPAQATLTITHTPNTTPPVISIQSPVSGGTYYTTSSAVNVSGIASGSVGVTLVTWACDRCGSGTAGGTTSWSIAGIALQGGANVITVTASDAAGNQASASLTVISDAVTPSIAISSPASGTTFLTSSPGITLSGTAADNIGVTQVNWSCDRCGTGLAAGTTSWTASGIVLVSGVNIITVTARDGAGNQSSTTLTVTYDAVPPSIAIAAPTFSGTYVTNSSSLNMSGTAADNTGVTQVNWSCDRCGSGVAAGTSSWSISGIALQAGANVITVTARDAVGNQSSTVLTVTFDATPPTIAIVSPTSGSTYLTSYGTLNLSGTASDNTGVTQVSWSCDRCGSGAANGTSAWSLGGVALQPGANVVMVTARDAAGNQATASLTVTFDAVPPTIAIVSPSTAGTYFTSSAAVNVSGTAGDNIGVTQVSWSCDRCGSGVASGTTAWSISGVSLQPGVNIFTVMARDGAGNQASATITVTSDNVAPSIAIVSPTSAGTFATSSASITMSGTAGDNIGVTQVSWSCDRCGSGVASGTTAWSISGISLQPGVNIFTVTARDGVGNQASATITVTSDTVAPSIAIVSPTSSGTFATASASITLSGTAGDNIGVTQVSWSCDRCGSGAASGTTAWSISGISLQPGVNIVTVTARDGVGNQNSTALAVAYGSLAPVIAVASPTSTGAFVTSSATVNVSGTAADGIRVTQVSWSCDRCGSGVAAGTTSWSISGIALQAGVNVITITARDAAGNQASATLTVTSDAIPPAVAIVSPTASGIFLASNASFTVSGNASDNIGVTQVSWSCDRCGSGVAQGTSAWSISGIILQAGINVITVTAADGTGNHATATLTVTYDGVPPAIAIVSPTAAGTYAASIANLTLSGSSSDNIGVVQVSWSCDLCGSGVAVGTTAWSINGISLSPGVNVITVTARDGAGNQASAALRVTFSTIPPSIVISSPTSGAAYSTANSSLNISGSASGPAGVSQVAWNCDRCGTGVASGTTSWSVSGIALQSGVNVITVTARDAAGNPSSATLTVNYDNVPPAIAIVSPTARGAYFTNSATLVLAGTSSDSFGVTQVTWQCDRCGSGTAVGTTNWSVSGITLQSGANAITVSASDAAGNKTSSSLTVTFDNVAPSIAIASPTAAASYLTSKGTLNISGTSSDNMGVTQVAWSCDRCGSGVASGTQSWSVAGIALQQGINVISVTASDAAGNRGSATLTVTYSSTPPTIAIAQPTTAGTYYTSSASVNISGTSADNTGVLQVAWSCDRCGSGVASGTTSWSVSGILLQTGANAISIIATDSAGNQAIATLTVIYITTPPNVALTSPTSAGTYSTSSASLNIAGTASNLYGVTQVTWQCDRCGSGVASGTSNWSVNGISLQPGGNTITVFASDVAGNRGSYMLVVTLIIYTPSVQSLSPLTSTGANQVYTFQYSDTAGAADLNVMNVLINSGLDGRHACYIAYVQQYNTLFLVNDAGDAGGPFAGSIVLGGSGSVNNSQCTIAAAGSTAFASGNTLTLTLNMSFSSSFGGNKVVYLAARDSVNNSGWQTMGTHGVPPLPSTFPMPGGMSPASGSAASSTLSFMFNDASSANNLQTGWALINTAIDGRAACYLAYFRPGNQVYLFPDNGDGSQAINMTLSGTNTLSNSQCTISSQGSSVTSSGAQLTVNLNITFNHSFAGPKGVWMADQTLGGLQTSAWQVMGVWKVP